MSEMPRLPAGPREVSPASRESGEEFGEVGLASGGGGGHAGEDVVAPLHEAVADVVIHAEDERALEGVGEGDAGAGGVGEVFEDIGEGVVALECGEEGEMPGEPFAELRGDDGDECGHEDFLEFTGDEVDEEEDTGEEEDPAVLVGDPVGEVDRQLGERRERGVEVFEDVAVLGDDEDHHGGDDEEDDEEEEEEVEAVEGLVVFVEGGAVAAGVAEDAGEGGLETPELFGGGDGANEAFGDFGGGGLEGDADGVAALEHLADAHEEVAGAADLAGFRGLEEAVEGEVEPDGVFDVGEDGHGAAFTLDGLVAADGVDDEEGKDGAPDEADDGGGGAEDAGGEAEDEEGGGDPDEEEDGGADDGFFAGANGGGNGFRGHGHGCSLRGKRHGEMAVFITYLRP